MTASGLANQMRLSAAVAMGMAGKPSLGIVSSYDPDSYAVKVKLQPSGVETGWLRIETSLAGAGWGAYFGPSEGDLATVSFLAGSTEVGWCTGFLPNDEDVPPRVRPGEIQLLAKPGSKITLKSDIGVYVDGSLIADDVTVKNGASGTFPTASGQMVTVENGIITNIY